MDKQMMDKHSKLYTTDREVGISPRTPFLFFSAAACMIARRKICLESKSDGNSTTDGTFNADPCCFCCCHDNPETEGSPSVVLLQPAGPLQWQDRLEHFRTGLHGSHLHLLCGMRRSETSPDTPRLTMLSYSFNKKMRCSSSCFNLLYTTFLAYEPRVSGKILGHTRLNWSSLSHACNNLAQQKRLIEHSCVLALRENANLEPSSWLTGAAFSSLSRRMLTAGQGPLYLFQARIVRGGGDLKQVPRKGGSFDADANASRVIE
jgi:hypothetical protein